MIYAVAHRGLSAVQMCLDLMTAPDHLARRPH
jgi:hypothetical protein